MACTTVEGELSGDAPETPDDELVVAEALGVALLRPPLELMPFESLLESPLELLESLLEPLLEPLLELLLETFLKPLEPPL